MKWIDYNTHSEHYEPLHNNFNNTFLFNDSFPEFFNKEKNINIFCGIPYNFRAHEYYKNLNECKDFPKKN